MTGNKIRKTKKYIFLDVDGVLNNKFTTDKVCDYYVGIDKNNLKSLKEIVDATNASIILTSTWNQFWFKNKKTSQDEFGNHLDSCLLGFGLEIENKVENISYERGKSILNFLKKEGINLKGVNQKFVILDDNYFDYKNLGLERYVVHTNFNRKGLTHKHALNAIKILNQN